VIDIQSMADYSCRPCRLVWLGDQECPFCGQPGGALDGTPLEVAARLADVTGGPDDIGPPQPSVEGGA
jgi:hypothetical protein